MLKYLIRQDKQQPYLETNLRGKTLLAIGQLNKGTAFTQEERIDLGLLGKLPHCVETIEQQAERAYKQYLSYKDLLNRNTYLNNLLNTNQTLFYKLLSMHLKEVLPTVYTPIVGSAVQSYNRTFTRPRGIYISYPDRESMQAILSNRTHPEVKLMVVTDGEGVLGIGDQGIGAVDIPVAKLAVYTAFAHFNPLHCLPIMLDVGTNNKELLEDPQYLGWRHPRISQKEYHQFLDQFIEIIKEQFPKSLIHWEDLGRNNAQYALDRYREDVCSFNDDIQGTGIVCLAALLSALAKNNNADLTKQKIVVFGAGTAGMGITDHICQAVQQRGLSKEDAAKLFYLVDRNGLITKSSDDTTEAQQPYLREPDEIKNWKLKNSDNISLKEVVKNVQPTILIGCSAQTGAFDQEIVEDMCAHCERPIILPLSNPTDRSEANPSDLYTWSNGKVLTATGSPFPAYKKDGESIQFSQCNNYLAFPGLGVGSIMVEATTITDNMLTAASEALGKIQPKEDSLLLPDIDQAEEASKLISIAVAKQAREDGVAKNTDDKLEDLLEKQLWKAEYIPYKYNPDLD